MCMYYYACQKIEGPRNVNFEKSKFKVWSDCVQNSVFIFGGQKVHRNPNCSHKQTVAKELEWRLFKKFRLALTFFRKKKRLSERDKDKASKRVNFKKLTLATQIVKPRGTLPP